MNSTDFEKIRLPLNFNLDNVYATGYAIKIENTETDTAIIKLFFILDRKLDRKSTRLNSSHAK